MKLNQKGSLGMILVAVIVVSLLVIGGFFIYSKNHEARDTSKLDEYTNAEQFANDLENPTEDLCNTLAAADRNSDDGGFLERIDVGADEQGSALAYLAIACFQNLEPREIPDKEYLSDSQISQLEASVRAMSDEELVLSADELAKKIIDYISEEGVAPSVETINAELRSSRNYEFIAVFPYYYTEVNDFETGEVRYGINIQCDSNVGGIASSFDDLSFALQIKLKSGELYCVDNLGE